MSDGPDEQPTYRRFDCVDADPAGLAEATEEARVAVEAGACIVMPTDTVYGIGADAFSHEAVRGLLQAKNRGRDMPPPVLVGDASLIRALATDVPDAAKDLVAKHWPGALTVICKIQPSLRMDLGDTDGTIALRMPDHPLAREILRRTGPMAVSSANLSGQPAALSCDEAVDQLGNRVAVYLDGGPLVVDGAGGTPSTIVDFTHHDDGQILRRGALGLDLLRETVPGLRDLEDDEGAADGPPADSDAGPTGEPSGEPVDLATGEYDPDLDPDQPGLFDESEEWPDGHGAPHDWAAEADPEPDPTPEPTPDAPRPAGG